VHQPLELFAPGVGPSNVLEVPDGLHVLAASAGVYNLLQPDIAEELKKAQGCQHSLYVGARISSPPVKYRMHDTAIAWNIGVSHGSHTVGVARWATGGPQPQGVLRDGAWLLVLRLRRARMKRHVEQGMGLFRPWVSIMKQEIRLNFRCTKSTRPVDRSRHFKNGLPCSRQIVFRREIP